MSNEIRIIDLSDKSQKGLKASVFTSSTIFLILSINPKRDWKFTLQNVIHITFAGKSQKGLKVDEKDYAEYVYLLKDKSQKGLKVII